jgi:hypothetical protein
MRGKRGVLTAIFLGAKNMHRFWIYFWVIPVLGILAGIRGPDFVETRLLLC